MQVVVEESPGNTKSKPVKGSPDQSVNVNVTGDGSGKISHNREIDIIGAVIKKREWDPAVADIRKITITVYATTAGVTGIPSVVAVVFDAPTPGIETAWLTLGTDKTDDSEISPVVATISKDFYFTSSLTSVSMKQIAGDDILNAIIEAS